MKNNNTKEIFSIALRLLIICSIVAAIIAFVYSITKDKIDYNNRVKTAVALSEIYGKEFEVSGNEYITKLDGKVAEKCTAVECQTINDDVTGLYVLSSNSGETLGYCVSIEPMGFKDVIKMLVAVNDDFTVKDVKIVTMSESSGYGTRAKDDPTPPEGKDSTWFLKQFTGKSIEAFSKDSAGNYENIDIISGATTTSKPVIGAVSVAIEQVKSYHNTLGGEVNE